MEEERTTPEKHEPNKARLVPQLSADADASAPPATGAATSATTTVASAPVAVATVLPGSGDIPSDDLRVVAVAVQEGGGRPDGSPAAKSISDSESDSYDDGDEPHRKVWFEVDKEELILMPLERYDQADADASLDAAALTAAAPQAPAGDDGAPAPPLPTPAPAPASTAKAKAVCEDSTDDEPRRAKHRKLSASSWTTQEENNLIAVLNICVSHRDADVAKLAEVPHDNWTLGITPYRTVRWDDVAYALGTNRSRKATLEHWIRMRKRESDKSCYVPSVGISPEVLSAIKNLLESLRSNTLVRPRLRPHPRDVNPAERTAKKSRKLESDDADDILNPPRRVVQSTGPGPRCSSGTRVGNALSSKSSLNAADCRESPQPAAESILPQPPLARSETPTPTKATVATDEQANTEVNFTLTHADFDAALRFPEAEPDPAHVRNETGSAFTRSGPRTTQPPSQAKFMDEPTCKFLLERVEWLEARLHEVDSSSAIASPSTHPITEPYSTFLLHSTAGDKPVETCKHGVELILLILSDSRLESNAVGKRNGPALAAQVSNRVLASLARVSTAEECACFASVLELAHSVLRMINAPVALSAQRVLAATRVLELLIGGARGGGSAATAELASEVATLVVQHMIEILRSLSADPESSGDDDGSSPSAELDARSLNAVALVVSLRQAFPKDGSRFSRHAEWHGLLRTAAALIRNDSRILLLQPLFGHAVWQLAMQASLLYAVGGGERPSEASLGAMASLLMESEPSEPQGGALSALIESTTRTKPVATGQLVVPRPPPVVMRTVEELVGFPDTVALPLAPDSSQPLCGAVPASPGEIIPERSWVAAWLDSDWILAMVLRHKSLTNKYVVLDIDPPVDRDRPPLEHDPGGQSAPATHIRAHDIYAQERDSPR